jgi:sRNA-binding protein
MRILVSLLLSLAAVLAASAFSTAIGFADDDKPVKDKTEKAEKADKPEKAEKPQKPEKADKPEKAEKERNPNAADPQHPHGGPPGLVKGPGDPAAPGLPTPPALGQTIGFKPVPGQGKVKIKLPGEDDWTELTEGETVPMGSTVDAIDGIVEVVAEADPVTGERQNALVYGSEFKVAQFTPAGAPAAVVDLVLKGGDFSDCKPGKATARAAGNGRGGKAGIVRGLWASGKGRFRTRGKHSAATVRGTRWATVDRCNSTTTKVFEGVVDVTDLELGKVVSVKAGERHIARNSGG